MEFPAFDQPYLGRALLPQIFGKVLEKVQQTFSVQTKLVSLLQLTVVHLIQEQKETISKNEDFNSILVAGM